MENKNISVLMIVLLAASMIVNITTLAMLLQLRGSISFNPSGAKNFNSGSGQGVNIFADPPQAPPSSPNPSGPGGGSPPPSGPSGGSGGGDGGNSNPEDQDEEDGDDW